MATVILDPGHGGTAAVGGSSANNAVGANGRLEKDVTLKVAKAAKRALTAAGIDVAMTRETDVNLGLKARAKVAADADAQAFISIHFNGFDGEVQGTETFLAPDGSDESESLATLVQSRVRAITGLRNRGVKRKSLGVLRPEFHDPETAAVLLEVSFMDVEEEDERLGDQGYIDRIGSAIAAASIEYLTSVGLLGAPRGVLARFAEDGFALGRADRARVAPRQLTSRGHARGTRGLEEFEFEVGLTKKAFVETNRVVLQSLLDGVNAKLQAKYGANCETVSLSDAAVLINIEAGLKGGKIDPEFEHSEGERGLLPLPDNITDWNGQSAPAWDEPMALGVNIWHFMLYLGHLTNKDLGVSLGGHDLYRDLFTIAGIAGNEARKTRILAGVVHGYFIKRNYSDAKVPFRHIIDGYTSDQPLHEMMEDTTYRHAGKPLMKGRHRNIEEAFSWNLGGARAAKLTRGGGRGATARADYFVFASEWRHLISDFDIDFNGDGADENATAVAVLKHVAEEQGSRTVMAMFDAGDPDDGPPAEAMEWARDHGMQRAIYVEGPGGATGDSGWSADEKLRVRKLAKKSGLTNAMTLPFNAFLAKWDDGLWQTATIAQLGRLKDEFAVTAAEIDNLQRVLGDTPEAMIDFYKVYGEHFEAGEVPRLIIKNIEPGTQRALKRAIDSGMLARAMFCEFHISEETTEDRDEQKRLSAKIDICTLESNDTQAYRAAGPFELSADRGLRRQDFSSKGGGHAAARRKGNGGRPVRDLRGNRLLG